MLGLPSFSARSRRKLLPAVLAAAAVATTVAVGQTPSSTTIAEIASSNENFSTLVAALSKADLVSAVSSPGPFTVFAPTNEAFSKLDAGTLSSLLRPENKDKLSAILTYHVVPGRLTASDLLKSGPITTLQGQTITPRFVDGMLKVNDSTITSINIAASNGVIHVIDTVLLPAQTAPMPSAPPSATDARDLIARAIRFGVPLFNEGNPEACVAVYAITARAIMGIGSDNVPPSVVDELNRAITEANSEHDSEKRAWILRRALDRAEELLADTADERG